jgi:hypothetical protein
MILARMGIMLRKALHGAVLCRPYGTPGELLRVGFPTLKRGANLRCAYGAGFGGWSRIVAIPPIRKVREWMGHGGFEPGWVLGGRSAEV